MTFLKQARVYQLLLARLFDGISSGMFMMALPWLMLSMGNNGALVALVALVCTVSSFLLTPVFATLIDRHSRKQILVVVQAVQLLTALGLLLYCSLWGVSIYAMALAQVIYWISSDVGWTTNNALVQENFDSDEYPAISSYQEVILQSITLGSGALGVMLLETWDIQRFSLFAAVVGLIALSAYSAMPYRRQLRQPRAGRFWQQMAEAV